ncbi:MAG TPA: cytochrome c-type biogenesis protein [Ktedonobacterales bacterium]|nr:cytochrome c-type biogenesis protein [Ktedonobacterales bacterium]
MNLLRVLRRPSVLAALALVLGIGLVWGVTAAHAAQPRTLDQRTYDVASQLQCPVCNGESVADASSEVALEMRSVVRQKLAAGESEQQVLDYFRHNYTDAILETPPKRGFTWLIWIAPWAMFVAALLLFYSVGREWRRNRSGSVARPAVEVASSTLTGDERARFRALLQQELDRDEGYRKGGD